MENEDLDISNAKKKLFAKAMDDKNMGEGNQIEMMNQSPYQFDLKTTDKGEVEKVGANFKLGDFSIGGSVNPGYTQTVGGFMGDQDIQIPTTYNVGATYTKGPFQFNYQHGTRGSSGGANVNMQF